MATTPKVYVICDNNCKYEGLTKEQIYAAITQAVNEGTIGDCDTGFITTVKTINGQPLKFFVGSQSEYEALSDADKENLFAIITNDTTKDGILAAIEEMQTRTDELINGLNTGSFVVSKANMLSGELILLGTISKGNSSVSVTLENGLYVMIVGDCFLMRISNGAKTFSQRFYVDGSTTAYYLQYENGTLERYNESGNKVINESDDTPIYGLKILA